MKLWMGKKIFTLFNHMKFISKYIQHMNKAYPHSSPQHPESPLKTNLILFQKEKSTANTAHTRKESKVSPLKLHKLTVHEGEECLGCKAKEKKLQIIQIQLEATKKEFSELKVEYDSELACNNIQKYVEEYNHGILYEKTQAEKIKNQIFKLTTQNTDLKSQIIKLKNLVENYQDKYTDLLIQNDRTTKKSTLTNTVDASIENTVSKSPTYPIKRPYKLKRYLSINSASNEISENQVQLEQLKIRIKNLKQIVTKGHTKY